MWAYDSRGIRAHRGREVWLKTVLQPEQENEKVPSQPQTGSRESKLEAECGYEITHTHTHPPAMYFLQEGHTSSTSPNTTNYRRPDVQMQEPMGWSLVFGPCALEAKSLLPAPVVTTTNLSKC